MAKTVECIIGQLGAKLFARTEKLRQLRQAARTIPFFPDKPRTNGTGQFGIRVFRDAVLDEKPHLFRHKFAQILA